MLRKRTAVNLLVRSKDREENEKHMAMIQCKVCGHEISENAERCPNCGNKTTYGIYSDKRKETNIKIGIFSGVLVIGLILLLMNAAPLFAFFENWNTGFPFYRPSAHMTFFEYLMEKEETGVFWSVMLGLCMTFIGGTGTVFAVASKPEKPRVQEMTQVKENGPWVCASCGRTNADRVGTCQSCGVTRAWSESKSK